MQTRTNSVGNYGKQFFSGVAVLAISTFIVKIIGLFYKIPMMAYLGAEGMGYFNSAYEIYSLFFVIATTGLPVAISILISESKTQKRIDNIKKIYRVSILVLGIIGILGTVLMSLFYKKLARLINNDMASYSILAISPTLVLICLSSAIRGYFQGQQNMVPTAVSQIIEALGKLFLGLGLAIFAIKRGYSMPIVAAFAVLGVTIGVAASLGYLLLFKLFKNIRANNTDDLQSSNDSNCKILKQLFSIAIPITISSTILSLTKIIDMTMILGRLGALGYSQEAANAIYGSYSTMAVSLYNLPSTIVSSIALPLVPLLTSAIQSGESYKQKSIISLSMKMTSLIAFPIGLGLSIFSKQILTLLFSSQAKEIEYTAPLLSVLGMSVFLSSMITVTNAMLQAYKQVNKPIVSMLVGTIVKFVLSFVLIGIPEININGAPISTFCSTIAIVAINLYFILKKTGKISSVWSLFGKPMLSAIISMVIGIAANLLLAYFIYPKLNILLTIFIVALIYVLIVLKTQTISKEEIAMLPMGEKIIKILYKIHLA